jgi:hypothetical protein
MEQLLEKSKVDKIKLRSFINNTVAEELGKLNDACYYPPWKKDFNEILYLTGLTIKDIRDFSNRYHIKREAADYVLKDSGVNVILFVLHYFLLQRDYQAFMSTMILLCIKFYSNRLNIHLSKYCNPEIFRYTLDNLTKTNLISREKTIPNFLFFIAKEMQRRWKPDLEKFDNPENISKFVYECRHRIAQTVKSFLELYYYYSEKGIGGYKNKEEEGQEGTYEIEFLKKGQRIIDDVVSKISVYKDIDKKALDDAKQISRINIMYANFIVNNLTDLKYSDDIRLIYELFLKNLNSTSKLCGKDFYKYVKDLMGIKRTKESVYYKKQIIELTEKIINSSKHEQTYQKLTNQTKFITQSFTSFYLTMYFRNKVC